MYFHQRHLAKIKLHYNIQKSASRFLDLAVINLQPDEKLEDLYQRLVAFYTDNLLEDDGDIEHHGKKLEVDEEITPAIESTIVVLWLQHLNPCLPQLVKQREGTELRNRSLASIKSEISQSLPSLLDELKTLEDSKVFHVSVPVKSQQQDMQDIKLQSPVSCARVQVVLTRPIFSVTVHLFLPRIDVPWQKHVTCTMMDQM